MIKAGQKAAVKGTVLRVDGERVDLQTPDGQLVQTKIGNVESIEKPEPEQPQPAGKRKHPIAVATRGSK